jgi:uncharacterized protein YjbI with pentapeptide repeats
MSKAHVRSALPVLPVLPVEVTGRMAGLRADCEHCLGLCCVAPAFVRSADFARDKPAGTPCPNLGTELRCSIHDDLRPRGYAGCAVYDCFGAGQQTSQHTFAGADWRDSPELAGQMFAAFAVARALHAMLWHLGEALALPTSAPLRADLLRVFAGVDALSAADADTLGRVEIRVVGPTVDELLSQASELARAAVPGRRRNLRGADLVGRKLRGARLAGADLAGAVLVGADLRDADLSSADLAGADLRGADLTGARAATSLFLSQAQLEAARGGAGTRIAPGRTRPAHWTL